MAEVYIEPAAGVTAVIELADGTTIDCLVNGGAYKPVKKLTEDFVNSLVDDTIKVTITDTNITDEEYQTQTLTYTDHAYLEFLWGTDNEWVNINTRSELELLTNELTAKIDFLAMMSDIDLDEA